jgi:hypothetical protein
MLDAKFGKRQGPESLGNDEAYTGRLLKTLNAFYKETKTGLETAIVEIW